MRLVWLVSLWTAAAVTALPHSGDNAVVFQSDALDGLATSPPPPPKRVPVTLAVMSRCPDAQVCEIVFDRVVDRVGGIMDLRLEYIGELSDRAKYGVECLHGDLECAGNIQQLCAWKEWIGVSGDVLPYSDAWNFLGCLNYGPVKSVGERQVAERCARVVGHDYSEIEKCAEGREGIDLLRDSVERVKKMGVTKSCSIIINGKIVCVHDGRWKNCDELDGHEWTDFASYIRREHAKLNQT